ncbi:MAG: hypothetical protein QOF97_1778 [Acidimicrobiaceae bacterium]
MKHPVRIVAAVVVALLLLDIPMASAKSSGIDTNTRRYGLCLSTGPELTICY